MSQAINLFSVLSESENNSELSLTRRMDKTNRKNI